MTYIHHLPDWPHFRWDAATLAAPLAAARNHQGRLLGRMESLGFELRSEANLVVLTADVVKSSAIEGETLSPEDVRSSIARNLGLDAGGVSPIGRDVDGIVELMLDATRNYASPLSAERLFGWHAALFPTGRAGIRRITVGAWRPASTGKMRVVSGPIGRERVHFEAPAAERLEAEMAAFLDWFNGPSPDDPVIRAAIAHFWFVTIHPFQDGNGRIARAIADMALARADGMPERYYSMSSQIAAERKRYYIELESAQRGGLDITGWLSWFIACLHRAIDSADQRLAQVLHKAAVWKALEGRSVNDRQRRVLNRLLGDFEGVLTTTKYARLAKCSNDTALRDIRKLLAWGVLTRNPAGGRSTSYRVQPRAAAVQSERGGASLG